jgi:hypothetical protein
LLPVAQSRGPPPTRKLPAIRPFLQRICSTVARTETSHSLFRSRAAGSERLRRRRLKATSASTATDTVAANQTQSRPRVRAQARRTFRPGRRPMRSSRAARRRSGRENGASAVAGDQRLGAREHALCAALDPCVARNQSASAAARTTRSPPQRIAVEARDL